MAAELQFVRTGDTDCFGCGAGNAGGLQLTFRQVGERTVEAQVVIDPLYTGPSGVVHGGIQATFLDEVMGKAAYTAFPESFEQIRFLTAELNVRYRRPAHTGQLLTARAEVVEVDDRHVHLRASLRDANGHELTIATSRWRYLPMPV